jgi:hypothetical protein
MPFYFFMDVPNSRERSEWSGQGLENGQPRP